MYNFLKQKLKHTPKQVKYFFYKAIAILLAWKLVYIFLLMPSRIIDQPLTQIAANSTASTINLIENTNDYSSKTVKAYVFRSGEGIWVNQAAIYNKQEKVLAVEDACNGLELFVLYAGFIICLPALFLRKSIFIFSGLIMIYLVNVFRCVGIVYVIENYPAYLDFTHHYLFTFMVYIFIIWLWLQFSKKLSISNVQTEQ
ncbi:MAG: exosortase/archaeosortase family protein [Bacteroidetes bacterium]|nr:exosortase/archaeosortase family protein [Bacteroidota bacterium]MBU1374102.1 exosortase/archaeosortase family protein [Bacteroidota bacterium]MBU1484558.1 exosortase/archaeosortase family protein [Bacteroidota bacterium]MBU1759219.1 exosortase/archaeosortase family protein [Bacteroidota bacterium]MBU2267705.1 exosortase/archaeosortase family protein [Bacteroidota bacterium]